MTDICISCRLIKNYMKPFVITQNKKSHSKNLSKNFYGTSIGGEGGGGGGGGGGGIVA